MSQGPGPGEYAQRPTFDVTHDAEPHDVLLAGFSSFGLAGLTAVDFLVDRYDLSETGHVSVEAFPAITPFEEGVPRHHTRFFGGDGLEMSVLLGELFVPTPVADPFSDAVFEWIQAKDVSEVTVVAGVPVAHGPDDHRVFYVATEDYRQERLADADIPPMARGFVDGVNAGLLSRGIDSPLAVGMLVTPVHPQAPDVEAAIRLVDAVASVYDLDVDTAPLEEFAESIREYYQELHERLQAVPEQQMPEDRMYG